MRPRMGASFASSPSGWPAFGRCSGQIVSISKTSGHNKKRQHRVRARTAVVVIAPLSHPPVGSRESRWCQVVWLNQKRFSSLRLRSDRLDSCPFRSIRVLSRPVLCCSVKSVSVPIRSCPRASCPIESSHLPSVPIVCCSVKSVSRLVFSDLVPSPRFRSLPISFLLSQARPPSSVWSALFHSRSAMPDALRLESQQASWLAA